MAQGKGDIQRPCDKDKFDAEWERIFGKKSEPEFKPFPSASLGPTPYLDFILDMHELTSAISKAYRLNRYL